MTSLLVRLAFAGLAAFVPFHLIGGTIRPSFVDRFSSVGMISEVGHDSGVAVVCDSFSGSIHVIQLGQVTGLIPGVRFFFAGPRSIGVEGHGRRETLVEHVGDCQGRSNDALRPVDTPPPSAPPVVNSEDIPAQSTSPVDKSTEDGIETAMDEQLLALARYRIRNELPSVRWVGDVVPIAPDDVMTRLSLRIRALLWPDREPGANAENESPKDGWLDEYSLLKSLVKDGFLEIW